MADLNFDHLNEELSTLHRERTTYAVYFEWAERIDGRPLQPRRERDIFFRLLRKGFGVNEFKATVSGGDSLDNPRTICDEPLSQLTVPEEVLNADNLIFFYCGQVRARDTLTWLSDPIGTPESEEADWFALYETEQFRTKVTWEQVVQKFRLQGKNVFLILLPAHECPRSDPIPGSQLAEDFRQWDLGTMELLEVSSIFDYEDLPFRIHIVPDVWSIIYRLRDLGPSPVYLRDLRNDMEDEDYPVIYTKCGQEPNAPPMMVGKHIIRTHTVRYDGPGDELSHLVLQWARIAPDEIEGIEVAASEDGRIKIKVNSVFLDDSETPEYTDWVQGLYGRVSLNKVTRALTGASATVSGNQ